MRVVVRRRRLSTLSNGTQIFLYISANGKQKHESSAKRRRNARLLSSSILLHFCCLFSIRLVECSIQFAGHCYDCSIIWAIISLFLVHFLSTVLFAANVYWIKVYLNLFFLSFSTGKIKIVEHHENMILKYVQIVV